MGPGHRGKVVVKMGAIWGEFWGRLGMICGRSGVQFGGAFVGLFGGIASKMPFVCRKLFLFFVFLIHPPLLTSPGGYALPSLSPRLRASPVLSSPSPSPLTRARAGLHT